MGRGTSPLRSVVRGSPRKPLQENMDPNCLSSGDLTPSRKPLSSISNCDENGGDAATPKGMTPKGKKRGLFPHNENVEGTKSKKAHNRHQDVEVGADETAVDAVLRGQQGSENANSHTPRAQRNERGNKHGSDYEPVSSKNCNQISSATPAKSVTRTLKYGAAQAPVAAGSVTTRALVALPGGGRNAVQLASEQQFNLEEDPTFWLDHNVQVSTANCSKYPSRHFYTSCPSYPLAFSQ